VLGLAFVTWSPDRLSIDVPGVGYVGLLPRIFLIFSSSGAYSLHFDQIPPKNQDGSYYDTPYDRPSNNAAN
jgi:hypothetical protein